MSKRLGRRTLCLAQPPSIIAAACVAGKKEAQGPLAGCFDFANEDVSFGQKSWEKAESYMQQEAVRRALAKADLACGDIDYILAGDLLNQCMASSFGLRELQIPLFGLYGACSTMAESLSLAALLIDGEFAGRCVAVTSSHFCAAERQYRYPLEYGGQRTPTAQWTVTGAGAMVLGRGGAGPYITHVTVGKIVDMGIKDSNNMGAAMAPAACDTLKTFFDDTSTKPADYGLIVTGDLGTVGSALLIELMSREGFDIRSAYNDCGMMIYDQNQDAHAGGSGCGCSATVMAGKIVPDIQNGNLTDVLFVATGALMSPTSVQQKESIPGIAHLVRISKTRDSSQGQG